MSDQLATVEDYIAFNFDPVTDVAILSKDEWIEIYDHYILASNLSAHLLGKNKTELVELARKLVVAEDGEALKSLRETLEFCEGLLKDLSNPIQVATLRFLSAGCVLEREMETS